MSRAGEPGGNALVSLPEKRLNHPIWSSGVSAAQRSHAGGRWFDPSRAHSQRPWKQNSLLWSAVCIVAHAKPCETRSRAKNRPGGKCFTGSSPLPPIRATELCANRHGSVGQGVPNAGGSACGAHLGEHLGRPADCVTDRTGVNLAYRPSLSREGMVTIREPVQT